MSGALRGVAPAEGRQHKARRLFKESKERQQRPPNHEGPERESNNTPASGGRVLVEQPSVAVPMTSCGSATLVFNGLMVLIYMPLESYRSYRIYSLRSYHYSSREAYYSSPEAYCSSREA